MTKSWTKTRLSVEAHLSDEENKRAVATRYQDLALVFRRKQTGDIILSCGGRWDNLKKCFVPGGIEAANHCKIIDLQESQLEFATWFATWLTAFIEHDPRDTRLVLTAGERRGGKTTIGLLSTIATCIGRPNTIAWVVSSTFQERDEIENAIRRFIPGSYWVYKGAPRYRFIFPNGSVLRCLSADDPETLKQGQVDIVMANEAQKMPVAMLTNAIPGIIDRGGLMLLAANPPRKEVGVWVLDLKEAIDSKRLAATRYFGFDAKLNDSIDQQAKADVGSILRVVDERAAQADDEGLWLRPGDVAYPKFVTSEHVRPMPQMGDITQEFIKSKLGRPRDYLFGCDWQFTPHNAAVAIKVFRGPQGQPIFFAVKEFLITGSEDDLLDAVDSTGVFVPENSVWIGDASGTWQDGQHRSGRDSFTVYRSRRWEIHPPRKALNADRKPSNPPILDRLNLMNNLLQDGRLFIDPVHCPKLALAMKKCSLKHDKPSGFFAHICDAFSYAIYWATPRPGAGSKMGAFNIALSRGNGF